MPDDGFLDTGLAEFSMADHQWFSRSRSRAPRSPGTGGPAAGRLDLASRVLHFFVARLLSSWWAFAVVVPGCSHSEPERTPDAAVRLVDLLDRASFERTGVVAPRELEVTRLAAGAFEGGPAMHTIVGQAAASLVAPRLDEGAAASLVAARDGISGEVAAVDDRDRGRRCIELRGCALLAWVCPIDEGLPLEATLTTRGEFGLAPEWVELEEAPPTWDLSSPEDLAAAIDDASVLARAAFQPVGEPDASAVDGVTDEGIAVAREWRAVIRTRLSTKALLFWATSVNSRGTVQLTELRIRRAEPDLYCDPIDAGLGAMPTRSEQGVQVRGLRVPIEGSERESIVLDAPESMRMTLRLPDGASRLRFAFGALQGAPDATCSLRVEARLPDGAAETDLPPVDRIVGPIATRPSRWEPAELDVHRLAGRVVELRFRVDVDGTSAPFPVAIGSPVIEPGERHAGRPVARADARRDVVLISLDTLRRDRLEPYGYPRPTSPRLRELAAESWVFENAISPSSWTLPAHASLFTGRVPQGHRVTEPDDRVVAGRRTLLAQCFRAAGYETVAFTGSGFLNPRFGMSAGFERYGFSDPVRFRLDPTGAVELLSHRPRRELAELLHTDSPRPRFVFVHTYAVHDYVSTPDDLRAVGASEAEVRSIPLTLRMRQASGLQQALAQEGPEGRTVNQMRDLYDASVRIADRLVGEVIDALRESGRLDETILIVCSDHGEDLLERGHLGHGTDLGERQIRIPLIVRVPGAPPRRVNDLVSLIDLAPTLAGLCGVTPPEVTDGRSLASLFANDVLPPRGVLLGLHGVDGLRTMRLKLVEENGHSALFDVVNDPFGDDDISARSEERVRLEGELAAALEAARRVSGARRREETHADVEAELRALGYVGGR